MITVTEIIFIAVIVVVDIEGGEHGTAGLLWRDCGF